MNITRHPSDELILDYASGALTEGWSLAMATHLSLCSDCCNVFSKAEALGGLFLKESKVTSVPDEVYDHVINMIDVLDDEIVSTKKNVDDRNLEFNFPKPLQNYIGKNVGSLNWQNVGFGAQQLLIPINDTTTKARLLRIPAGKPVPEHSHCGRELTIVLSGGFYDKTGNYGPGDLQEAYDDLEHQPHARDTEDCICLAVTAAPLKFSGLAARLAQPFLDI